MPELPEVETVRRQLVPAIVGRKILRVECTKPSYFFLTSPAILKKRLVQREIIGLERRGKTLLGHLDAESRLLLHLGMTGQIVTRPLAQDGHVH
jgi:formamidopyrimidine-DNA glycosylase